MEDEKLPEICRSCGRFDKIDRLEEACRDALKDFLEHCSDREFMVRGPECSDYWRNYLPGLISKKSLSVKLRIVNGEFVGDVYNLSDYCKD